MHQFVHVLGMASTMEIIYTLQTINNLYKNVSVSMYLYNSAQYTGKCLALRINVKVSIRHLKEKLEILNKLECSMKAVDVYKTYDLSQLTLSTWKKQKLKDMVDAGKVPDTKHNCELFLPNVKRALHIWFGEMTSKSHALPLIKPILVEKST